MSVIIENSTVRLVLSDDAKPQSLLHKPTGEELLASGSEVSMFSVTQERPYNNEIKLVYMNQRTTYPANSVRRDGDMLTVGFELAPYRALVEVKETEEYFTFTLRGFDVGEKDYEGLKMQTPPAVEFRLIQLPVRERDNYGRWLNVMWDKSVAAAVVAACPRTIVDADRRVGYRVMHASAMKSIKMMNASAALIVSETATLMDKIDVMERDLGLPLGVESRRDPRTHGSIYWTSSATPLNIDEHIALCKAGGFTSMMLYYPCIYQSRGYEWLGDYRYRPEYPEGAESVRKMLKKITDAGILPGLHVLATHIGLGSTYVRPVVDHRLRIKKHFTLAKPLSLDDTTIYVEQDPSELVMEPKCRVLNFGGEAISYESYTTEPPYRFENCHRGWLNTNKKEHPLGEIGGLLDISEYCAISTYLDQDSSLQDEIADRIMEAFNQGFRFMYFDGAEGTSEPFGYTVSLAQYKLYKKMDPAPVFCTGAAKTHFGWHMLSGGNAFDLFPTDIFKAMIDKYPVPAAAELRKDFTVVNFGWWKFFPDTQPDTHEYGVSRAVAWDCPVTVMMNLTEVKKNPRYPDVLEAVRRWQDANKQGYLTEERKAEIRTSGKEYTMLINEAGEYEMRECELCEIPACPDVRAYVFERDGRGYASIWSKTADTAIRIEGLEAVSYKRTLGGEEISTTSDGAATVLSVGELRYLTSSLGKEALVAALSAATL
ncbi:MAG: hypothetical protein IKC73_07505 [Clostridia bacterium]|nr:hypothetical protein [Clostridia bacterium]